jgi:hypothetical protein
MAQTKQRPTRGQAKSAKRTARTNSSKTNSAQSKASSTRKTSRQNGARKAGSQRARSSGSARSSRNGSSGGGIDAVRHAVGDKAKSAGQSAKSAGQSVGKAAGKAKMPLVAGGAALAGAAGGLALASSRGRKGVVGTALRKSQVKKPQIKVDSGDVAKVAKQVGNFSAHVGELAGELQRARESADERKHRSPIEVVLQGLTARR